MEKGTYWEVKQVTKQNFLAGSDTNTHLKAAYLSRKISLRALPTALSSTRTNATSPCICQTEHHTCNQVRAQTDPKPDVCLSGIPRIRPKVRLLGCSGGLVLLQVLLLPVRQRRVPVAPPARDAATSARRSQLRLQDRYGVQDPLPRHLRRLQHLLLVLLPLLRRRGGFLRVTSSVCPLTETFKLLCFAAPHSMLGIGGFLRPNTSRTAISKHANVPMV